MVVGNVENEPAFVTLLHGNILAQARKRTLEIDRIFKRIYEDDISGAINHDRF